MKKYIVLLAVLMGLLTQQSSFSAPYNACALKPYPVSNGFSRTLQGMLGLNFFIPKGVELAIENNLRKTTKGDVNVTLKPYSAFDLKAGKLKGVDFTGKNMDLDGIYVTSLEAKSLCDFVYINYHTNPIVPLAPLYLSIKGSVSENDFNRTFSSKKFKDDFSKVKMRLYNTDITLLDLMNSRMKINGDRLTLTSNIHFGWLPQFMTVPVKIDTGLKVVNNQIKFDNAKVAAAGIGVDLSPIAGLFDIFNPTILDANDLEKNGSKIDLKNVYVKDGKVNVEGTVWLPANYKA